MSSTRQTFWRNATSAIAAHVQSCVRSSHSLRMAIDYEDVQYEDSVSSDTCEGEDSHLEMQYEDRYSFEDNDYPEDF